MTTDGKEDTCQVTSRPLALSTRISDLNQILVSSLVKLSRSGEHNLRTLHVPHQAETQVDSGQALVNMASFYAL